MQIGTQVFERIVHEARTKERDKAIVKIADVMMWAARFSGYTESYRRIVAEYLYDNPDCKEP